MKILFFFLLCFSIVSLVSCIKNIRGKTKEALDEYITELGIGEIPGIERNVVAPLKSEVNGGATSIRSVVGDLTEVTTATIQKIVSWEAVKARYINPSEYTAEKLVLHLKYMRLRMVDILMMIKYVFTKPGYKTACTTTKETFDGTYNEFTTPCVVALLGPLPSNTLQGQFYFASGGSQSLSSDIDISVDFRDFPTLDTPTSIYPRLQIISKFISDYNKNFVTIHGASSLRVYDVNLYAAGFGHPDIVAELVTLQKDKTQWPIFEAANRLAQLLLVYNDALNIFTHQVSDNGITFASVSEQLEELKVKGSPKLGTGFCSNYLFVFDPKKPDLAMNAERSSNDEVRNNACIMHARNAGTESENVFRRMCHVLAAHYFALEAYVSYGATILMLASQNILRVADLPAKSRTFVNKLGQNAIIDSVLMNFAYCVEHYYHEFDSSKIDAQKKFAKYAVRTYYSAQKLTNAKHKKCWNNAFKTSKVIEEAPADMKNEIERIKTTIINGRTELIGFAISQNFFKKGYACIKKYAFTMI